MSRFLPQHNSDPPGSPKSKSFSRRRTPSSAFKLVPPPLRSLSLKMTAVYLNGLILFLILLLYLTRPHSFLPFISASSSSPSLSPEAAAAHQATVEARLSLSRSRTLLTDASSSHSHSLPKHLINLDASLARVYATHPVLKDHAYQPTVYTTTLTPYQQRRYAHLRPTTSTSPGGSPTKKWLFTSVLLNVAGISPDMFAALAVATDWLGAENVGMSVVEGPSQDGTDDLFERVLAPMMVEMGVDPRDLHLNTRRPGVDFSKGNRIEILAKLRDEAILPLRRKRGGKGDDRPYEASVFFNDVFFSGAQLLEMIHQHTTQSAHMTCAWDLLWGNSYFYDTWVGRDIHTGDLFQKMGETWDPRPEEELFPTSPKTKERFDKGLPFQAAGCWNGIAILSTSLIHPPTSSSPSPNTPQPQPIHFRRSNPQTPECASAEVSLLTQDMWARTRGHARILVVPGVRVAYERHVAEGARDVVAHLPPSSSSSSSQGGEGGEWEEVGGSGARVGRGTKQWGRGRGGREGKAEAGREKVEWVGPPKKIRCHPWPEMNGTGGVNVWETTRWVDPLSGM